jgi:hypothetical protein
LPIRPSRSLILVGHISILLGLVAVLDPVPGTRPPSPFHETSVSARKRRLPAIARTEAMRP